MELNRTKSLLALASGLTIASLANGAGFAIVEQSVAGLGNAFSGAAGAEDASVMFFNPAGMSFVDGPQVQAGTHYLMLNAYFKNSGTVTTSPSGATVTTSGADSDGGFKTPLPNLYYLQPLTSKLTAGLSVNCPFGLGTEYDEGWVGRYMARKSEIQTFDVSPALSYKVTDSFSIGVGFDLYYIDANLTSDIDLNKDGTSLLDGFTNMKADDDAYGYHLGMLWQATTSTRFGLSYRSQITTHLKGTADFTLPANLPSALAAAQAVFVDQGVGAELDLPSSLSFNVYHNLTDKIDLMADVTWTDWSTFYSLDLNFENALTESVAGKAQIENWRDTIRYSAGMTYKLSDTLKLRGGLCFDPAAVRGAEFRTPRIPDAKRFWVSTGLNWKLSDKASMDFAYVHIFVDDPDVDNSTHTAGQHLVGTIEAYMDIVSASFTYKF
ncbi:MAG TPA: outer membrane protein transport protein [Opitutales bacterium]|nr:outer membrane protein transport protein [Opitutales bacterium]